MEGLQVVVKAVSADQELASHSLQVKVGSTAHTAVFRKGSGKNPGVFATISLPSKVLGSSKKKLTVALLPPRKPLPGKRKMT